MKNRPLALAAVILLAAASVRADENAARHEKLDATVPHVLKFCGTVDGWRIAKEGMKEGAADAGVKIDDSDMGNWAESQKTRVRKAIREIKGQCAALRDPKTGLAALTAKGAALEKIDAKVWESLTDELDGILETYQGRNNKPEHYKNYYKKAGKTKKAEAIYQLTSDAPSILAKVVDRLAEAIAALRK